MSGVGDICENQAGNAAQQGPRLGRDALCVGQMTGVVVGDRDRKL